MYGLALGLMPGTSADGVTAVLARFGPRSCAVLGVTCRQTLQILYFNAIY